MCLQVSNAGSTVRRFQNLPREGAELVVVRAHTALIHDGRGWTDDVALFSNERIDLDLFDVTGLHDEDGSSPTGLEARPVEDEVGPNPVSGAFLIADFR